MASAAPVTHLKLFMDQGERQVALFSGPDEVQHWLRNVSAEEVLQSGWHLLPRESLITVEDVESQGFLRSGVLMPEDPSQTDVISAWAMRAAGLASRQAEQEANAGHRSAEASLCERVVRSLELAMEHTSEGERRQDMADRRSAWLLRGVNGRLEAWNQQHDAAEAEALAQLFAALSDERWHDGKSDLSAARGNQQYWRAQALSAWAQASQAAEERGELEQAERCSQRVLAMLQHQEPEA